MDQGKIVWSICGQNRRGVPFRNAPFVLDAPNLASSSREPETLDNEVLVSFIGGEIIGFILGVSYGYQWVPSVRQACF